MHHKQKLSPFPISWILLDLQSMSTTQKTGDLVANEVDSLNMKEYLTKLYQGVEVLHSFTDENGSVFDLYSELSSNPAYEGFWKGNPKAPDLPGIKSEESTRCKGNLT